MELPDIQPYAYTYVSLLVYINKLIPSTLKRVLKLSTSSGTPSGNLKQPPGIKYGISSDPGHGAKRSLVSFCYAEKHG